MAQLEVLLLLIMLAWCPAAHGFCFKAPASHTRLLAHTQDPSSSLINSLLNRMIQLGTSLKRKQPSVEVSHEMSPVSLSFTVRQKFNIIFNNSNLAMHYLALPPSEYSVLDSSLVRRKDGTEDTFTFSLSLAELTAGLNPNMFLPVVLSADIRVDVNEVQSGLLLMESGSLTLEPVSRNHGDVGYHRSNHSDLLEAFSNGTSVSFNTTTTSRIEPTSSVAQLPPWMMVDGAIGNARSFLSPIQSMFKIVLQWDPTSKKQEKLDDDTLGVKASIDLKFNATVGVPSDIARIINFPLMKILIQRIFSLTTKSILTSVAPQLSRSLVQDYEKRKERWQPRADNNTMQIDERSL